MAYFYSHRRGVSRFRAEGIWGTVKIMVHFLGPYYNTGPNLGDPWRSEDNLKEVGSRDTGHKKSLEVPSLNPKPANKMETWSLKRGMLRKGLTWGLAGLGFRV